MKEVLTTKGDIQVIIEHDDGHIEIIEFPNTILTTGRAAIASALANSFSGDFDFFISRMLFGDGGTTPAVGGIPKTVVESRNGLFGVVQVNKPVIATIDPNNSTQVTFTSVVSSSEGNGVTINEMALEMNNGDLYSMATFPGLSKTASIAVTFNWRLSLI